MPERLRPPRADNMTEFVVEVFVLTVAGMLLLGMAGAGLIFIIRPEYDITFLINTLTDIMTTIIGALIGYIAGKGAGAAQVHSERAAQDVELAQIKAATAPPSRSSRKTTKAVAVEEVVSRGDDAP